MYCSGLLRAIQMTHQVEDIVLYQNKQFVLSAVDEGELFSPSIFNLRLEPTSTATRRGYHATYAIADQFLVLQDLRVQQTGRLLSICGVDASDAPPSGDPIVDICFDRCYVNLNCKLPYTGRLLIGMGLIGDLYWNMGFHPAWKYEIVLELQFESGLLIREINRSEEMKGIRNTKLHDAAAAKANESGFFSRVRARWKSISSAFDRSVPVE